MSVGSSWPIIAIVDTGVDRTHPDLASKVLPGWNFVSGNSDASDDFGHGTHVAGIAAAVSNNVTGVAGIAWQNPILPVKVLDSQGSGTYDAIANGIIYAADRGASVINLSLGGFYGSTTLSQACQYAYQKGCVLVAAAGNNDSTLIQYPAAYPTVIAVGATDQDDGKAWFSNYGRQLSVTAPGVDILSTTPMAPVTLNTLYGYATQYDSLSGTSMACPHVAGVAGLLLSVNPNLGPDNVRHLLQRTALDLGELGWDELFGYGRIQADAAVRELLYQSPPDTTPPSLSILTPADGQMLTGPASVSISTWDNVAVSRIEYSVDGVVRKVSGTQWLWQTGQDANGQHALSVTVSDYAGNSTARTVVVSVSNQYVTDSFSGSLKAAYALHPFRTSLNGRVKAVLTWGKGANMWLQILYSNGAAAADAGSSRTRPFTLEAVLPAGDYVAKVSVLSGKTAYTLSITHLWR
jgi:subtilisin family serine protease